MNIVCARFSTGVTGGAGKDDLYLRVIGTERGQGCTPDPGASQSKTYDGQILAL